MKKYSFYTGLLPKSRAKYSSSFIEDLPVGIRSQLIDAGDPPYFLSHVGSIVKLQEEGYFVTTIFSTNTSQCLVYFPFYFSPYLYLGKILYSRSNFVSDKLDPDPEINLGLDLSASFLSDFSALHKRIRDIFIKKMLINSSFVEEEISSQKLLIFKLKNKTLILPLYELIRMLFLRFSFDSVDVLRPDNLSSYFLDKKDGDGFSVFLSKDSSNYFLNRANLRQLGLYIFDDNFRVLFCSIYDKFILSGSPEIFYLNLDLPTNFFDISISSDNYISTDKFILILSLADCTYNSVLKSNTISFYSSRRVLFPVLI